MAFDVIFGRVVCIEKCFRNFEIVVGSAVSEMSRFSHFYVLDKLQSILTILLVREL